MKKNIFLGFITAILPVLFNAIGYRVFLTQSYTNPDSLYAMDLIWQHRHLGVPMGTNAQVIDSSHIHWANLYLYLIDYMAYFFGLFVDETMSINIAGSFLTFISMWFFSSFCIKWLRTLYSSYLSVFLTAMIMICANFISYGPIIAITHHNIMLCLIGVALIQSLYSKQYIFSSILTSLALWISPEVLPFSLIMISLFSLSDIKYIASKYALLVATFTSIICCIDPIPSVFNSAYFIPDRISFLYALLFIMLSLSTFLIERIMKAKNNLFFIIYNAIIGLTLLIWYAFPIINHGFHNMIPYDNYQNWYVYVGEIKKFPLDLPNILWRLPSLLMLLFIPFIIRNKTGLILGLSSIIYAGLSYLHSRSSIELTFLVGITIPYLMQFIKSKNLLGTMLTTYLFSSIFYASYLLIHIHTNAFLLPEYENSYCNMHLAAQYLGKHYNHSIILTDIDDVPDLLWNSKEYDIKTFAGPYHRDAQSMREAFAIYQSSGDRTHQLLKQYHVDYILKCGNFYDGYNYGSKNSFWNKINKSSNYIQSVKKLPVLMSGYNLYKVY